MIMELKARRRSTLCVRHKATMHNRHFVMRILSDLVFLLALLTSIVQFTSGGVTKLNGWTEVNQKKWPIEDKDYFIATEHGHHFIEIKNLPKKLKGDLRVSLEYFYSYAHVKPVVQMTPCSDSIYLHDSKSDDKSNKWLKYNHLASRENCANRSHIEFNVLLHDAGDVFAWREFSIEYLAADSTTTTTTTKTTVESELADLIDSDMNNGQQEGPDSDASLDKGQSMTEASTENAIETESPKTSEKSETAASVDVKSKQEEGTKPIISNIDQTKPDTIRDNTIVDKPLPSDENEKQPAGTKDKPAEDNFESKPDNQTRSKREAVEGTKEAEVIAKKSVPVESKIICKPSSCDRSLFRMARFVELKNGLPKLPANISTGRLYLDTKGQPLNIKMYMNSESFNQVDHCFEMMLYMDPDTELELSLDTTSAERDVGKPKKPKLFLLEHIVRRASDLSAGKWEKFERCMSDYMPNHEPMTSFEAEGDSVIKLAMQTKKTGPHKLIGISVDDSTAFKTFRSFPVQSFAPDLKYFVKDSQLELYWKIDPDGLKKATWKLLPADRPESSTSKTNSTRQPKKLVITDIDPSQDYFDITSRWMQIKDAGLIEQPIALEYHAEWNDWIDQVQLQFQRAGSSFDKWISKDVYVRGNSSSPQTSRTNTSLTIYNPGAAPNGLDIPLRLRGLDSELFRVRLRHKLKPVSLAEKGRTSKLVAKSLVIDSLAFNDACSYQKYDNCQNGGECYPTGPATAECRCLPGYSGPFCESVNPCAVLYMKNTLTGAQVCESIGASCIETLPVLRCIWPNDKYYHCEALNSKPDQQQNGDPVKPEDSKPENNDQNSDNRRPTSEEPPLESLPLPEQVSKLKETIGEQAKTIIILVVFLIAIVIFAVVLVGSMVGRLRKSKSRLERSKSEAHELARRFSPTTSSRAVFGVNSRAPSAPTRFSGNGTNPKASSVTSYNNAAFDVE